MANRMLRWSSTVVFGAWLWVGCSGDDAQVEDDSVFESDEPSAEARSRVPDLFWWLRRDGGVRPSPRRDASTDAGPTTLPDAGTDAATMPPNDGGHGHGGNGRAGLPCDVATIVAKYCGTCHGEKPSFGAPMALASAADFAAARGSQRMVDHVKARINQADPRGKMPPASSAQPTAPELATLNAWLDKGAPTSTETCKNDGDLGYGGTPIDTTGLTCYKLTAHDGTGTRPFAVGAASDKYYNFTFTPPWKGKTVYAVVIRPVIDNTDAIHHWLLYQDPGEAPPASKPASDSNGTHPGSSLVAGWAPGGQATNFRPYGDVGMELPGNTPYTIEYHYNSSDPNAKDASGAEICVTEKPPANIAGQHWLGYDNVGAKSTHWTGTCQPTYKDGPIRILAVVPHMHMAGIHMKATINRVDGTKEILHDADFDFNYQVGYPKDVKINPGDTITTDCTYSQPQSFGQRTDEEMCYLFTIAYPKNALSDNGPRGKYAHGNGACLGQ